MNIQDKINDLQAQLDAMKAQAQQQDKPWPQEDDQIFFLSSNGDISLSHYDIGFRNECEQGLLFRSELDAQKERDRRALIVKLKALNGDWVADWHNMQQPKFSLSYNHLKNNWFIDNAEYEHQDQGTIYLSSPAAEAALAMGHEVLKCLL